MAIFVRRDIQRMLDSVRGLFDEGQWKEFLEALNGLGTKRISAEWELAVIYGLSQSGDVKYEREFGVSSRIDVWFKSDDVEFIADVATVSDEGLIKANPADHFLLEVCRIAKKEGVDSYFHVQIGGNRHGEYGNQKLQLALPRAGEVHKVLGPPFKKYLREIREKGLVKSDYNVVNEDVSFTITYDAIRRNLGAGYPSFDVPYSRTKNPVYRTLRKKAAQLKKAYYEGKKGIVITDGGCGLITSIYTAPVAYSLGDVVHEFLRNNGSISFVAALSAPQQSNFNNTLLPFGGNDDKRCKAEIAFNKDQSEEFIDHIRNAFGELLSSLPLPAQDGSNAQRLVSGCNDNGYFRKGFQVSGKEIRISARVLENLLSGRESLEKFLEFHNTKLMPSEHENIFESQLRQGNILKRVRVEHDPKHDDDWVILEFGFDPSRGKFI